MRYLTSAFALLLFFVAAGQQKRTDFLKHPKVTDTIKSDSLLQMDEFAVHLLDSDSTFTFFKKEVDTTSNKVTFHLKDHPVALKYDSLFLRKMYDESLYDSIHTVVALENTPDEAYVVNLPTDTLKARLRMLDSKTPFNIAYNPILEQVIHTFLQKRRKSLQRLINLSEYYYPMFETQLDAADVPLEIKHLAIVESALNPVARSRVGATGLWQFMFQTGKMYGLELNSFVDDRSNPLKSTQAAAKYLSDLYKIFGDWDLVLAAYNSGPGNVNKAIRRSGGYQNYWNIRPFLPRETQGYLPAFLATLYIFEYAEAHGFERGRSQIKMFETDTIQVKKSISFKQLSQILSIPEQDIYFLNPSYKLKIIPHVEGKNYWVRLPKSHAGLFVTNEKDIYAYLDQEAAKGKASLPDFKAMEAATVYRVRSGDFLGKIAERYGVSVNQIKQWNGLRNNNLRIGQRLTIYPKNPTVVKTSQAQLPQATVTSTSGNEMIYTVKNGDSLWSIAQKFPGVSVENIKEWNGIRSNNLKPGMKLKLLKS
ncbi:MAG: LysM peptidoglycan-binding domain-containing protein [Flavobacteriaceae bacterium]|nr:LysM peptidoglycan-binding domain-containing protein [Flavobacteriaceae bacterium]